MGSSSDLSLIGSWSEADPPEGRPVIVTTGGGMLK